MDKAAALFNKLLEDNNLTAQLTRPEVKYIENGGVIIEPQKLFITFTNPPKEEVVNELQQPQPYESTPTKEVEEKA